MGQSLAVIRMHDQAMNWLTRYATDEPVSVLDVGGRNVNGSPRGLYPNATVYRILDIAPGDNVDIVADASTWEPDQEYDVVVCAEVFEHTDVWPGICATIHKALKPQGRAVFTMAGPGRQMHSAVDGGTLRVGEYYGNVDPYDLKRVLKDCGFQDVEVDQQYSPCDVRAVAVKG